MVNNFLLVGAGGAAGSLVRYMIQQAFVEKSFLGTFLVNLAGSLVIGILMGTLENNSLRLLLMTGFCGGFTTFSAFSSDSILMLQSGRYYQFLFYSAGTFVLGIFLAFIGFKLSR